MSIQLMPMDPEMSVVDQPGIDARQASRNWQGVFQVGDPLCIQPAGVERSVLELTQAMLGASAPHNLRSALHTLLNSVQTDQYTWTPGGLESNLQFALADGLNPAILQRIMVLKELPPGWAFSAEQAKVVRSNLLAALELLHRTDAALCSAVSLVFGAVIFARLEHFGGGGNSGAMGCLWLNPKADWDHGQWVEHLVHEYVHQALFIDDMRYGIFTHDGVPLAQPEALVMSALLEIERPLDRAFHSAFVAYTLMRLYQRWGQPEFATRRWPALVKCTSQLAAKSQWLTAHGAALLASLQTSMSRWPQAQTQWC